MTRTIIAICGYTALMTTLSSTATLFIWLSALAAERRAKVEATRQDAARAVRELIATLEGLRKEREAVGKVEDRDIIAKAMDGGEIIGIQRCLGEAKLLALELEQLAADQEEGK